MIRYGILMLAFVAVAHAEVPKRLIETAPGQRSWMTDDEINSIIEERHLAGKCGGFFDVTDMREEPPAGKMYSKTAFTNRVPNQQRTVDALLPLVAADRLTDTVKQLSAFPSRHHNTDTGVQASEWVKARFEGMSRRRNDVSVKLVTHRFKMPSVVATIAGSGPRAAQKIVLGAHLDSINMRGISQPAPGADDDASGVATLLEIFQILTQTGFRPDRTIEFIAYSGEEGGLLGSQQIAADYRQRRVPVYAVVQFDMTMYPGQAREMTLIRDHTDPDLSRFTGMLIDTYVKARWGEDRCGYGCSDHASWTKYGYPSVMPFEAAMGASDPNIHTARDTLQFLDASYGVQFAKLGVAWAVELATGD